MKYLISIILLLTVNQIVFQTNDPVVSPILSVSSNDPFTITPPSTSGTPQCRSIGNNKGCVIDTPQDNNGNQRPAAGNPINLGSGNKLKKVTGLESITERNNIQWSANGDVLSEQRPNGVTITNTYYPLTKRLETTSLSDGVKTLVTKYEYLNTGQVNKVFNNFGATAVTTLTMTYDGALRLTQITDSLGNYQQYVLDTEGNVLNEKIFDPSHALKKIITQTFDVYNQVDIRTTSGVTVDYKWHIKRHH